MRIFISEKLKTTFSVNIIEFFIVFLLLLIFISPLVLNQIDYAWLEFPYVKSLHNQIATSLFSQNIPLWNPLAGPGGVPAVSFANTGWDYRLFLKPFLNYNFLIALDIILIFGSFIIFTKSLRLSPLLPLLPLFIGFLFFYSLDWISTFIPALNFNSIIISYFLLLPCIYLFEIKGSIKAAWLAGFIAVFSEYGAKIEIIFQFYFILLVTVVAIRVFMCEGPVASFYGRLIANKKNIVYGLVAVVAIVGNWWQYDLIFTAIQESSRIKDYSYIDVLSGIFYSFKYSNVVNIYLVYLLFLVGIIVIFFRRTFRFSPFYFLFLLISISTFISLPERTDFMWFFTKDFAEFYSSPQSRSIFIMMLVLPVLVKTCGIFLNLKNNPREIFSLIFTLPMFICMVFHFIFENQRLYNTGSNGIEMLPLPVALIFIFFLGLSVFYKGKNIFTVGVVVLFGLFFVRSFFQVPLIKYFGVVWHVGRDTFVYSAWLSIFVTLGAIVVIHAVELITSNRRYVSIILFSLLGIYMASELRWPNFYNNAHIFITKASHVKNNPQQFTKHDMKRGMWMENRKLLDGEVRKIIQSNHEFSKHFSIATATGSTIAGAFMDAGAHQVDAYDSTIPSLTIKYLQDPFFDQPTEPMKAAEIPLNIPVRGKIIFEDSFDALSNKSLSGKWTYIQSGLGGKVLPFVGRRTDLKTSAALYPSANGGSMLRMHFPLEEIKGYLGQYVRVSALVKSRFPMLANLDIQTSPEHHTAMAQNQRSTRWEKIMVGKILKKDTKYLLITLSVQENSPDSVLFDNFQIEIFQSDPSQTSVPPLRCNLPFIFFPNNVQRVFDCTTAERVYYYTSTIIATSVDAQRFLDRFQVKYMVKATPPGGGNFRRIDVGARELDGRSVFVWENKAITETDRREKVGYVEDEELDCMRKKVDNWNFIEKVDDYFMPPFIKQKFNFNINAPGKGCVLLRVAYSKQWQVENNDVEVIPVVGDGMFMKFPVVGGENEIVLKYYPHFKLYFLIAIFVIFLWLVSGRKIISKLVA